MFQTWKFALLFALPVGSALAAPFAPHIPLSPLFATDSPVKLGLKGEFQRVKEANGEGNWKGDDRSDPKFWSAMELTDLSAPERNFTGQLRARGMSSALEGEGDFPKLKIEIHKGVDRKNSLFVKDREFRINTHVSTHPESERTEMGRLNDERAPYREALAYDWSRIIGMPTIGYRRAEIAYQDSGTGEKFVRKALLLEKDKSFGERYGAKVLSLDEFAAEQETRISAQDSALFHLFHALIGNKDFILRVSREPRREDNPIWGCGNCLVLEKPDGSRTVAPYDFDLSTLMAGEAKIEGQHAIFREFGFTDETSSFLARAITSLKARHPEGEVRAALSRILSKGAQLKAAAESAALDDSGRAIALRHLDRFSSLTEAILDLPVIAAPGIPLFRDSVGPASKMRPLPSGGEAFLRPGTPVKVIRPENGRLKVAVLDFHWDLEPDDTGIGYIPANAPISTWVPEPYLAWRDERDAPEPDSRRESNK
jgi:hypothetical protein